jgi:hypothetical protein
MCLYICNNITKIKFYLGQIIFLMVFPRVWMHLHFTVPTTAIYSAFHTLIIYDLNMQTGPWDYGMNEEG